MSGTATPLQIFKLLPKSNCRQCGISTCLAFAAAVIKQEKRLADCPHLDRDTIDRYAEMIGRPPGMEGIREEQLKELKKKIEETDIHARAELLGARSESGMIVIKCLGKDFAVDTKGTVASQCHTHAWFSLPLLDHIIHSRGAAVSGNWVPFRELQNGRIWNPLFEQRCEKPLKQIADTHSELFGDLVNLFSGASKSSQFGSDISVVLHPFPTVPIMICYWKPEDGIESKLHLFFDETAEQNLSIESLFTLGTGLVRMFERIMCRHSNGTVELS